MKMLARAAFALSALFGAPAVAVPVIPQVPNAYGSYVPAYQVQEQLQLVTGNTVAAPQAVFGGTYIFAQLATGYGSIALVVLGPDGNTYETVISKTGADSTGGTAIQLQGGATVKAVLTGTTAANVTLTRVP